MKKNILAFISIIFLILSTTSVLAVYDGEWHCVVTETADTTEESGNSGYTGSCGGYILRAHYCNVDKEDVQKFGNDACEDCIYNSNFKSSPLTTNLECIIGYAERGSAFPTKDEVIGQFGSDVEEEIKEDDTLTYVFKDPNRKVLNPIWEKIKSIFKRTPPMYECSITVKRTEGCNIENRGHICQLYKGYSIGDNIEKACDFCVKRSKFLDNNPEECINIEVRKSSFADQDDSTELEKEENNDKEEDKGKNKGKNKEKDNDKEEECDESSRLIDGECISKCDYYLYPDEMKGWMVWDYDLDRCMPEDDLLKVYAMKNDSRKVADYRGTELGVIKYSNGAVQYTKDGIHFFNNPDDAKDYSPGIGARIMGWINNFAVGGKSKEKDTKKMQQIADAMTAELEEKARNYDEKKSTRTMAQVSGAGTAGLVASQFIGPLSMGISMPGNAVALAAQQGVPLSFSKDLVEYIKRRQDTFSNSIDEIKGDDSFAVDPLTKGLFKNNDDMYAAFETGYKRYLLAKQI